MRIWDVHCHLSPGLGETPEERLARLVAIADRLGIERLCVYMGMRWSYDPAPLELREANDQVLRAIERFPSRAFGFVYLNPRYPDESIAELDRCVRDGPMVGVKLWVAERASAPGLDPIIRRAGELRAVVFQHTWVKVGGNPPRPGAGNLPGESTPDDLVELARRHPAVPIICGHTGGDWELGIRAVRAAPSLSVEIGGSFPTAGMVEMAVRELGAARVIYGSDAGGRSFSTQLAKVIGANIPESDKQLIAGENLRRVMTPILKAKGIHV